MGTWNSLDVFYTRWISVKIARQEMLSNSRTVDSSRSKLPLLNNISIVFTIFSPNT
jgi:hypothetical protein